MPLPKVFRKIYLGFMKRLKFLPSAQYVGYFCEYYTGRKYHDEKPTEFHEKIQWLKAHFRPKILNQLVDKYAVRQYVERKIGVQYLNECYGVYNKVSQVDFDKLPQQFVLKATHGYGFNLLVPNKQALNLRKARLKMYKWLSKNQYYRGGQEWAYKDVPPRIIAEAFLHELGRESLTDYKFYCFSGKAKFLEVHLDREQEHKSAHYDLQLNKLPFNDVPEEETISHPIEKPKNFEKMIQLAEILADRFPFVRVDFYNLNGKIIFGEMTFYPADGRIVFHPEEYNRIVGDMMSLPALPQGKKEIKEW